MNVKLSFLKGKDLRGFFRERETIFFVLLLFLIAIGICWPLFRNQFPATYDHDFTPAYHLAMRHYLGRGQLLPVWVPDFNHGYGSAVFNFYPPLFFLLSALIDILGVPSALAINLASFLVMFLSAWAMFILLKELINSDGAFLGSVAYLMAPYHAFDLYKRGVDAEVTSFIFLPLIFWGIHKIMKEARFKYFVATAAAIAGLLLSHMIMSVFFLPVAVIYLFYLGLMQKEFKLKKLGLALSAILAGFCLSAFSTLPAILEKNYLNQKQFVTLWFDYHSHFLNPIQFLFSPQEYSSWLAVNSADKQPFEFGWFYIFCFCAGAACMWLWASKDAKKVYSYFFLALLATIWMMTGYSRMVWEWFSTLALMQFPWRLLEPASFFACAFIACIGLVPRARLRRIICMSLVALIIIVRLPDFKTLGWFPPVSNASQELGLIRHQGGDFKPVAAKYDITTHPDHMLDFSQGSGEVVSHQQKSPVSHSFQIFALTPVVACFYNYYFPGWQVTVDGQKTKLIDNNFDLILFAVVPGWHKIDVHFLPTPAHTAGVWISLLSLAGMILKLIF